MEMEIRSRKADKTFTFWMNDQGGYVWLFGQDYLSECQISEGGGFRGDTVRATPQSFRATCQRWYRAYTRNIS